jgi:MOSC domain-containing protein YiiM
VLDVALPDGWEAPLVVRSFAACLASAAEVPLRQIPLPGTALTRAIGEWRSWLAGRGAGLVPIADPGRFNWPGYWIAVLGEQSSGPQGGREKVAVLMFGTPAGVVLSPQDRTLLGRAAADLAVERGYLLASLNPELADPVRLSALRGHVDAIAVAEVATGPMRLVDQARAFAGRGLDGDRYAAKAGTFTPAISGGRGYDLTLIEAEVLDQLLLPEGHRLGYAEARRNIITRGIDLNTLVGRRFRIGNVECLGQRLCEPCAHLERLTTKGVLRSLIHRGGLRADVLSDGLIVTRASIETTD